MSSKKEEMKREMTHPISTIYAYISRELDGSEAIMTLIGPNGAYPLIGSDLKRMMSLRPMAETTAERYGRHLILARFSKREDLTHGHQKSLPKERGRWE